MNQKWEYPIGFMYGIYKYTYIYHTTQPNVDTYIIHGAYGVQVHPKNIKQFSSLAHIKAPKSNAWDDRNQFAIFMTGVAYEMSPP